MKYMLVALFIVFTCNYSMAGCHDKSVQDPGRCVSAVVGGAVSAGTAGAVAGAAVGGAGGAAAAGAAAAVGGGLSAYGTADACKPKPSKPGDSKPQFGSK